MTIEVIAACAFMILLLLVLAAGCYSVGYSNGDCDGFKRGLSEGRKIERGER